MWVVSHLFMLCRSLVPRVRTIVVWEEWSVGIFRADVDVITHVFTLSLTRRNDNLWAKLFLHAKIREITGDV